MFTKMMRSTISMIDFIQLTDAKIVSCGKEKHGVNRNFRK